MFMNGNQHAEEQQQQLQFQHLMTSIGVGPMKRPVPFSAAYPPQPHMMDFHGEALPHRQIIHFPPQVLMQSLSPESQMTPLSAKQYQHKFHMHHGYAATASPAPTNRQPSHDFPLLQHQHQAQHEHPLQQISGDESGACIFPSCDGGWGQGIAPRMEINQASGIVVPVAKQNVDINCSPVKNTPKPEMSTVAVVTSGVSGDSSKSTQAVYEKSMEDPGMVLKRRFAARLAGLNAMHVRRQRLEQEVTAALERQQASLIRSQELDERLERQNDAWKRARQREAVAARELTTAREELHSLRSWLKMKSETFEEEVESYGKELRKIIEKARVAPEIHETERLKEVLEILQKEQAQQEVELGELDVGLQNAKKEYTEILTQDKNFSVCSEEDITTAIMMLVEEANQTVAEQGEESHRLLELEKNLLVERDVILREKEQRERPLRAIFTRATDVSATIANPMTVPVSSTSHIHSTARLAKIPGQE